MSTKYVLLVFFWLSIDSFIIGHIIKQGNINDLFMSGIKFDLKDTKIGNNVTYYSYHIHVYFLQKNQNQTSEAILLRDRFLKEFNVDDCNDECETWCPKICHWNLNTAPIGYNIDVIFF